MFPDFRCKPLWLLAAGYWAWLIWVCAGEWTASEDYAFGWLVAPLAAYFLWKRMEAAAWVDVPAAVAGRRGLGLAWAVVWLSLLAVMPLDIVRQTPIHWRPNLWAIGVLAFANTLAVAFLSGGASKMRIFVFPALFMLVGIPWPTFVENAVSFPLMQSVTRWSVGLIHLLGYPATAAGTTITLPNCNVGVEEACSGLRSLQTALMVGLAAGELVRLVPVARILLLLVAFGMALAGNQFRVLILVLAGIGGGSAAVQGSHDAAGYAVLGVLLAGVGCGAWIMARAGLVRRTHPGAERDGGDRCATGVPPEPMRLGWVVLAFACFGMLAAHGWYWWRASLAAKPAPAILRPLGDAGFMVDKRVPQTILDVLRPDDYSYIRESVHGAPARVVGYHFYWKPRQGNANQLYHRPDRCMPGAGWRIQGKVTRETIRLGGHEFTFNVFPFQGPGGPALMLWGAYLNGEPVEIEFNTDVYLGTANLWQFVRTGTRVHSYEVAALIMPHKPGNRPSRAEIEAYANQIFEPSAETRAGSEARD